MKFSNGDFRKSKACWDDHNCVEVAMKDGYIGIRDSKQSGSPVLAFNKDEWSAFIAGVKAGEFDV